MTRARKIITAAACVAFLAAGALAWVLIVENRGQSSPSAEVNSSAASDQHAKASTNHNVRKRPIRPRQIVVNLPNEPQIEADSASAERALTPEDLEARDEAREKELFKEINALQAEMMCRRWAKALKLTEEQKQMVAPIMEQLRQFQIDERNTPPLADEVIARLEAESRQAVLSGELSKEQAGKRFEARTMQLDNEQRDRIAGEQVATMESLRPYLDVGQAAKLDILVQGLKDSRNMVAKMHSAANESIFPTSARPAQ